jgi:hypothetical protein
MLSLKNPMQQAFIDYVASIQPSKDKHVAAELEQVRLTIERDGKWQEQEEWRISTWFDMDISTRTDAETRRFCVRVECDGQEFKAICPSLEKAFLVSKFYRKIIVEQFYSVGPTWA